MKILIGYISYLTKTSKSIEVVLVSEPFYPFSQSQLSHCFILHHLVANQMVCEWPHWKLVGSPILNQWRPQWSTPNVNAFFRLCKMTARISIFLDYLSRIKAVLSKRTRFVCFMEDIWGLSKTSSHFWACEFISPNSRKTFILDEVALVIYVAAFKTFIFVIKVHKVWITLESLVVLIIFLIAFLLWGIEVQHLLFFRVICRQMNKLT